MCPPATSTLRDSTRWPRGLTTLCSSFNNTSAFTTLTLQGPDLNQSTGNIHMDPPPGQLGQPGRSGGELAERATNAINCERSVTVNIPVRIALVSD
jgi:hypothetical protein